METFDYSRAGGVKTEEGVRGALHSIPFLYTVKRVFYIQLCAGVDKWMMHI
jgi:hypothetical protein